MFDSSGIVADISDKEKEACNVLLGMVDAQVSSDFDAFMHGTAVGIVRNACGMQRDTGTALFVYFVAKMWYAINRWKQGVASHRLLKFIELVEKGKNDEAQLENRVTEKVRKKAISKVR